MDIIDKIESFAADIYFKLPVELNKQYVEVCTEISNFFDKNFVDNSEVMQQKNKLFEYLLGIMETKDFIRMADALCYTVKPIFEDNSGS
jgi:predicted Zn-dependent protease with MMP-like domain